MLLIAIVAQQVKHNYKDPLHHQSRRLTTLGYYPGSAKDDRLFAGSG